MSEIKVTTSVEPIAQSPDELASIRRGDIKSRLLEIDILSIRAIRTKSVGRGHAQDDSSLVALDDEADALRVELAALQQ